MLWASVAWAGWSVIPMPAFDYSTDHGFGYGGIVLAVRRLEDEEAYRLKLTSQVFWSTGTFRDHWVRADWNPPNAWRVEGVAGRRAWDLAPYFGFGDAPLAASQDSALYTYAIDGARSLVSVRRQVQGPWELFATAFLRTAAVSAEAGSKLDQDGLESGVFVSLGLGVLVDTRDNPANPSSGQLSELSVRGHAQGWGVNLTGRHFWSPHERLTLANRSTVDLHGGETPFYVEHILGGTQWLTMGGPWGLRAFPEGRFRADGLVMLSPELRWKAWTVHPRGKHELTLMPTPFADLAWLVVYDDLGPSVRANGGLGTRLVWNEDMVMRVDVGLGREKTVTGPERSLGVWFMFDHPF